MKAKIEFDIDIPGEFSEEELIEFVQSNLSIKGECSEGNPLEYACLALYSKNLKIKVDK